MNALAYVVAILNPMLLNSRNVAVRIGPLHSLADDLTTKLHLPPDTYKDTNYFRTQEIGFYVSKNLRNYINGGEENPNEEGVIIIISFDKNKLDPPNDSDPVAYLLHPNDFSVSQKQRVEQYIQTLVP